MKQQTKRPTPLAVRMSATEKLILTKVADDLGTSRNHFVRTAAMALANELKIDATVRP
jgi:uncharacterized protein (DUF1778 family)